MLGQQWRVELDDGGAPELTASQLGKEKHVGLRTYLLI